MAGDESEKTRELRWLDVKTEKHTFQMEFLFAY
jgi:hypothetical protein